MLIGAARISDLVRGHGGVADEDTFVVGAIGSEHIPCGGLRVPAAAVVAPYAFIKAVVEVEVFEMLELGAGGREEFLQDANMRVHGAADIEEKQHFDGVAPLGAGLDVKIAVFGGGADRAVQIQFICRAVAGPAAQALQGHLDVAGA